MAFDQKYLGMTDGELVEAFRAGNKHDAYTAIVERYQRKLYYSARRMVGGDHVAADEVAQDTFVKAYEALGKFRGESGLFTWLYRIMSNSVIHQSRRRSGRITINIDDVSDSLESEELLGDKRLEASETTKAIEAAIEQLPDKQRQVFIMRFYDELPYDEIAGILGTSVGGLKANYFHAVKKIGEYLKKEGQIAEISTTKAESSATKLVNDSEAIGSGNRT